MRVRRARPSDAAAVTDLLGRAYPALMAASYDADVLAAALPAMVAADPDLLASGTYYVVEDARCLAGCGGWTAGWTAGRSTERPVAGGSDAGLAHLRHFATRPDMARRGVGRAIFARCAADAAGRGVTRFRTWAALNAEPFYRDLGLRRVAAAALPMGPVSFPVVLMEGPLPARAGGAPGVP